MDREVRMLSLAIPGRTRLCDSWTRRELLRVGGLSALGLTLADWFRAEAAGAASAPSRAKSVILIFNCGAPSHIDAALRQHRLHHPRPVRRLSGQPLRPLCPERRSELAALYRPEPGAGRRDGTDEAPARPARAPGKWPAGRSRAGAARPGQRAG